MSTSYALPSLLDSNRDFSVGASATTPRVADSLSCPDLCSPSRIAQSCSQWRAHKGRHCLLVDLVCRGISNDAPKSTDATNNGDNDSEEDANPAGPEMPVAHAWLLQHQPDDRWQPEGGWASPQSSNESHQVTEEGNGASQEAGEADIQTTVDQASRQAIGDSVLHQ